MSGMECPYCKSQMERGSLRSRGGVYFLPECEKIPKLYLDSQFKKHNAVPLPPYWYSTSVEFPEAWICRNCHRIVIEYEEQ